jgi:hypothetical protein
MREEPAVLDPSAKLTFVSAHEQLLFSGDRRQKVILGGELLPKLSRTVHRDGSSSHLL